MIGGVLMAALLVAQQQHGDSGFFHKGDWKIAAGAAVATGVVMVFDERIAHWVRESDAVQGDSVRLRHVKSATVVNEVPLTIAAVLTYGIGMLAQKPVVADVGAHLTEALVTTIVTSEVVRSGLGRARPHASPDDAFDFHPGGGLTKFEYRAFPSLHAAVAFTAASVLTQEMKLRHVKARRYWTPVLFAAATIPGFTRIYLDQHWSSDVVAGSVVGWYIGTRMTQYAHGHRTWIDRALLGGQMAVRGSEIQLSWTFLR